MKTKSHTDAELIRAYQLGDPSALALLVKRWHLLFCKKAYWIVKDPDVSKDIAQESWKTIIAKLGSLQKPSSFNSWALRIVYSKSLDTLRQMRREQKKAYELSHNYNAMNDDYDEKLYLKEALLTAINNLSYQHQMVIKLFYIEEYSLKEISNILNISIGTAKSRMFHAREQLKLILKHYNYEN